MNNDDKFQFVEMENIEELENESSPLVVEDSINAETKKIKKFYFGFEARIVTSVILILVLFVGACFLGIKVINYTSLEKVSYNEDGNLLYQVCKKDSTCVGEMDLYNVEDIDRIKIFFNYSIKSEKEININETYHISSILRAYDTNKTELYYENENELVEKTSISSTNSLINRTVIIDYNKYSKLINEYEKRESIDELEVALYIDDIKESRKVSSLIIPLSSGNITISKNNPISITREKEISVNVWDFYSIIYTIFSSILVIISLILIYRTTRLVLKSTNSRNAYHDAVDHILREYDNIIVCARDGYESIGEKEIIKLDSFDELIEIKDRMRKPIIFSKINDIKCEFLIEDDVKLYKYVMKEVDFSKDR